MVLFAPLIQYGATLISALTVLLTVSVAAPGGFLAMREFTRTLDYSARVNMAMLSAGNVDRYKRMLKQSVDSALVYHGYDTLIYSSWMHAHCSQSSGTASTDD